MEKSKIFTEVKIEKQITKKNPKHFLLRLFLLLLLSPVAFFLLLCFYHDSQQQLNHVLWLHTGMTILSYSHTSHEKQSSRGAMTSLRMTTDVQKPLFSRLWEGF